MRLGRLLWWMGDPLLEVRFDPVFSGRIVPVVRGQSKEIKFRSYDHRGQGYGWVPDRRDLEWGIDVEYCQRRGKPPLAPDIDEMAFLCGWTRCEAIAKFGGYPAWIVWKKFKQKFLYEPGYQMIFIEAQRLSIYTCACSDMVFSLACSEKSQ